MHAHISSTGLDEDEDTEESADQDEDVMSRPPSPSPGSDYRRADTPLSVAECNRDEAPADPEPEPEAVDEPADFWGSVSSKKKNKRR